MVVSNATTESGANETATVGLAQGEQIQRVARGEVMFRESAGGNSW